MKKITLFVIFITSYSIAKCQLDKGTWLAGGSGSFYSYHENGTLFPADRTFKYKQFDISAEVGLFLIDKLVFGIRPTFSSISGGYSNSFGGFTTNTQRYKIGPFIRYYFLNKDKIYNLIGDLCYQPGFMGGADNKGHLTTYSAFAGPVLFFNSSVGIEILMGYSYNKESTKAGIEDVRKGFQTSIGFQIHLQKY